MIPLTRGCRDFLCNTFPAKRSLFESLAHGQDPDYLFITCSDSRIVPNLITQTDAGELFVLRNAGNIIPPYGSSNGGEEATIEYALTALRVKHVVVCGHTHCGAMTGLLHPEHLGKMPAVSAFLAHAARTRQIVQERYSHLQGEELVTKAVEENVLVQLENLRTFPSVASALEKGRIQLHGWVYKIESGEVLSFDPQASRYQLV